MLCKGTFSCQFLTSFLKLGSTVVVIKKLQNAFCHTWENVIVIKRYSYISVSRCLAIWTLIWKSWSFSRKQLVGWRGKWRTKRFFFLICYSDFICWGGKCTFCESRRSWESGRSKSWWRNCESESRKYRGTIIKRAKELMRYWKDQNVTCLSVLAKQNIPSSNVACYCNRIYSN